MGAVGQDVGLGAVEETVRLGGDLRVAVGRIARRLRQAHRTGDLTFSEASVLARLDREGPTTPGVLAELERVRPQAMTSTVGALERRGLIARSADVEDGRRVVVSVTEQGRRVLTDMRQASTMRLARGLEQFTPAERARLEQAVPLLDRLAGLL
ncbi:MarR family transcriptional regulator [Streptomyces sp. RB6PN25]|uniref:MarR family transcriptional regulator n=1 Tax=Streptomyces humicola TaxID=2953240 RepID=A0ABT1PTS4_9ACTN|nr:MarR family transcriptional regulator [Streptomyces humicola]MCQ4079942.1 MarR family transcriptional regulator [Streptomyces humicola]